jgi:hypothetical protein
MELQQRTQGRQPPLVLSEQKEQIIRACALYQYLTVEDLCYILGMPTSRNYVRRLASRLSGKKDQAPGEYLYRFALPQRAGGNGLRVFVPGEASRNLFQQEEGEANGFVWNNPATMQRYSYSYVVHNLAVTRLALCATLFCRECPVYYLAETRLAYDIARTPPRVSLTTDGKPTTVSVIPDLWLFIERATDGQGYALWFEIDNATTFRQSFQRRLSARLECITQGVYAEYFGTPVVLLGYAVIGRTPQLREARMHTLRQWTHELLVQQKREQFARLFRFTAVEYETLYRHTRTLFTEPVWYLPGEPEQEHPQQVSLLPPAQTLEASDGNDTPHPSAEGVSHHSNAGNACQAPPQCESVSDRAFCPPATEGEEGSSTQGQYERESSALVQGDKARPLRRQGHQRA